MIPGEVGTLWPRNGNDLDTTDDNTTFHPRSTVSVAQQKAALKAVNRPYAEIVAEKRKQAGPFLCAVGDVVLPCLKGTCDTARDARRCLEETIEENTKEGTVYDTNKKDCINNSKNCANKVGEIAQNTTRRAKDAVMATAVTAQDAMIRQLPWGMQGAIHADRRNRKERDVLDASIKLKEDQNPPFILNVVDQRARGMSHAFEARAYTDLRDIKGYLKDRYGVDGFDYFIINDKRISAGDGDGKLGIQLQDLRVNERNSNIAILGGMKKTRKRRKKITKRRKMVRRNKRTRRLV